ncbi:MAG: hypothetical protein LC737_03525, partial [Chloroflexi bacterium]|nr:hypothetical protein [Chloroflexota bacterium]
MSRILEHSVAGKIIILVSDLHIGAGRSGGGNVLEDFTSDTAFAELLSGVARESVASGRAAELIVNGDFGEFLQVPTRATYDSHARYTPDDYRDMGERASAQKLQHIMAGHPLVFDALRDWLRADTLPRTLTITKGNHDPQWQWGAVQRTLRDAIGANDARAALVEFPAVGIARDGLYVEHGNQYSESANRFTNFAAPFAPSEPTQLELPWGSRFVIEFFNDVERDKYWVDGVKPYKALVWYALEFDPPFAFRTLAALVRAAPKLVSIRDEIMDAWRTNLQMNPDLAAARFAADPQYRR